MNFIIDVILNIFKAFFKSPYYFLVFALREFFNADACLDFLII